LSRPPETGVSLASWQQLLIDLQVFLNRWGAQAAALGWSTLNLFGVHRSRPLARYDAMGLVLLLDGAQVVAMTEDSAKIRTRTGAIQTYCRRTCDEPGQAAIWDLCRVDGRAL
jgi:hypothetical protein